MDNAVTLNGIGKSFGSVEVLAGVDLVVAEGSFTALLGPSGCGKTTLLNLIGGLDRPSTGRIRLGRDVVYSAPDAINVPTERRNIGYVFQSYALWPHMTVLQNVAYALKIRRMAQQERERQAKEMLEKLELSTLAERYPFQLSGGQQQRVAIARSIVYRPRLLLLDEPLSNLDAQLRERARAWLKSIHETFGLTTILVTHDQNEALSLSDQVVLMSKGRVEQLGSALEIYERPETAYAAEFVGGANIIHGKTDGDGAVVTDAGVRIAGRSHLGLPAGSPACIAVRPQKIRLIDAATAAGAEGTAIPFELKTVLYQGANYEILGTTPLGDMRILTERAPPTGEVRALLPAEECLCVRP